MNPALCPAVHAQVEQRPIVPVPKLTQAQAIKAAADFCSKIGAPVDAEASAIFPVPDGPWAHHWQDRWRITFPMQAEVEVVDASGSIAYYASLQLRIQRGQEEHTPARTPIKREQAVKQAMAVIEASGDAAELTQLDQAILESTTEPATAGNQSWLIVVKRTYYEVPYYYQGARLRLQPDTGRVYLFAKNFRSPAPTDLGIKIDLADARATANQQIATLKGSKVVPAGSTKEIDQSNRFWQGTPGEEKDMDTYELPESHVVQAFYYRVTEEEDGRPGERMYEVWVDLFSGKVIGGIKHAFMARPAPKLQDVKQAFRTADEIRVYQSNNEQTPFAVINAKSHPEMLSDLKTKTYFLSDRTALAYLPAKGKIVIVSKGVSQEIGYNLEDGLVMFTASSWAIVSNETRKWLLEQSQGIRTKTP